MANKKNCGPVQGNPLLPAGFIFVRRMDFFFSSAVRTNLFLAFFFPRAVSGHLNLLDAIASRPFKWFMIL